jgi:predicted nucleotidyltransferase
MLRRFRNTPSSDAVIVGSHRKPEAAIVPIDQYRRLTNPLPDTQQLSVLEELRSKRELIQRLGRFSNIRSVQVFGSVAHGTETPLSDIDVLVDPEDNAGLFDLAQFAIDLEQLMGRPVDVVSRRSLDETSDAEIIAGAITL